MLSVVCWRWGDLFSVDYVNRLRSMLERNLRLPHQLFCVTDDVDGLDSGVAVVPMPTEFAGSPRCRRRMWQYAKEREKEFGPRMLCMDIDVVIVDDITPLVDRAEPLVCWKIGYAGVYAGGFVLLDTGALDGAWLRFKGNPREFLRATGERFASDQAMLNVYLADKPVAHWTEDDGIVTWFGENYSGLEHHGMGPGRPDLQPGTRMVMLGNEDKAVMDEARYDWVRQHWH